jgi:minor extracellular serine protease Vpr
MMEQAVPSARVGAFLNESGLRRSSRVYQVAFNGLAVEIGAADAAAAHVMRLSKLPGVKAVYADRLYTTQLYTSTALINAPVVWASWAGAPMPAPTSRSRRWTAAHIMPRRCSDGTGAMTYPPGYGPNGLGLTANNNGKIIVSRAYYRTWDPPVATDNTPLARHRGHPARRAHGFDGGRQCHDGVTYGGTLVGTISGVAPRAYVMSYKVFYDSVNDNGGFYTAEGLAALEDIVMDNADVVNNSWGGGPGSRRRRIADALDTALTNAFDAGVFVSMSAGNSGPGNGTTDHPSRRAISPWRPARRAARYASGKVSVPGRADAAGHRLRHRQLWRAAADWAGFYLHGAAMPASVNPRQYQRL